LGVNLFAEGYAELEGYVVFFQEFNIDYLKFDKSDAGRISKTLKDLGVNKGRLKEECRELSVTLKKMGFNKIDELADEDVAKIKEIANRVDGKSMDGKSMDDKGVDGKELNITILKNTAYLCDKLGVILIKPEGQGLSSKMLVAKVGMDIFNSLRLFNINLGESLGIGHKVLQLGYMANKYLECGNQSVSKFGDKKDGDGLGGMGGMGNKNGKKFEVSLDGKEDVIRGILAEDQGILGVIAEALEKSVSCQRHFEKSFKMEGECDEYFSELDLQIGKLCIEPKEDL
jgi:hypothetical protein